MAIPTEYCRALSTPDHVNFTISIIILIGILISYLPQHYRIISRSSSEGLSPYFVLLGTTSGTCALFNILVLPSSRRDLSCCHDISGFACFSAILGIAQVAVQWACFAIILALFLIYFPRHHAHLELPSNTHSSPIPHIERSDSSPPHLHPHKNLSSTHPSHRLAVTVVLLAAAHFFLTLIITLILLLTHPDQLLVFANILGLTATMLASIQYFPQIYTTLRLQHVGSLSIPMMLIQTPGSFLWAGSLAMRLGREGWSAWGIYLVTGCLQGTLLGICIVFELRSWRRGTESTPGDVLDEDFRRGEVCQNDEGVDVVEGEVNERSALLNGRN